jgi:hypothetical protein
MSLGVLALIMSGIVCDVPENIVRNPVQDVVNRCTDSIVDMNDAPGLLIWFNGRDPATLLAVGGGASSDNDLIETYLDSGPSNRDAIQLTGTRQPERKDNVIGTHSTVLFDGIDWMDVGDDAALEVQSFTLYSVIRVGTLGSSRGWFAWQNTFSADRAGVGVDVETGGDLVLRPAFGTPFSSQPTTFSAGADILVVMRKSGSNADIRVNGSQVACTSSFEDPIDYASAQSIVTRLGAHANNLAGTNGFNSNIGEVSMFDQSHSDAIVQSVENGLIGEWSL